MTIAPRGNVHSMVLARLLAPRRDIACKRVTLLDRPIDAASAAAIVESDLRAAELLATSSTKPKARAVIATRSAAATASEEATEAGLVIFGMIVTATVTDHDKPPRRKRRSITSRPPRAVVLASGTRPILITTHPWMTGLHAELIRASITAHDPAVTATLENAARELVEVGRSLAAVVEPVSRP